VVPPGTPARSRRRADRSLLRTPAVLLAVPCALVAHLFLGMTTAAENYALAQASAANGTMFVIGPYVAVAAVWETEPLRILWGRMTVARSWWRVLAARLRVVVAGGLGVLVFIYFDALARMPSPAAPGWQFPTLSVLGVLAWTAFGAALALLLNRLLAMTAALLVPYLLLVLPAGWEPLWLRHVNGMLFDCCGTGQILDSRALVASVGFLAGIAVLSLCVARARLAPARNVPWLTGLVALTTLAGVGTAVAGARELGAIPATVRPTTALVCESDICLWPEDWAAHGTNRLAWEQVRAAWSGLGLPELPSRIGPVADGDLLAVTTRSRDLNGALVSMAQQLPRALFDCGDSFQDARQNQLFDDLSYLLLDVLDVRGLDDFARPGPAPSPGQAPEIFAQLVRC
jgi:hypothetical protein